ncbi:probable BOI-related E3 ubiquitin-protein ligase 3 isoform X2 [Asparagus officinalis]|uniref:probable BOI-related E3 ubiquitin-protein ligase 3 isoform X2 n=1 Tax=Asparagus officinalis TaxID=4686 RepID=UPI00098E1963|nr:probable BOI-related E3 ubiquitin-protein ligase 3 isoform X2 [Asparagus officinalis]
MESQQPNPFRNFDPVGGQIIVNPLSFYVPDQPQAPLNVMKGPKEEGLQRPQVSSLVDFFKIGQVSAALDLSLDNANLNLASSSGELGSDFSLLRTVDGELEREMERMDAEMDSFIRSQGDLFRESLLENIRAKQFQTLASFEQRFRDKIQERDIQIQVITKRKTELEEQFRVLNYEMWIHQQQAKINAGTVVALRLKLQEAQRNREGHGDSEADSVVSSKEDGKDSMACKACGVNEMCMLLLPCRHLCLCKTCEGKLSYCPVCHSSKFLGVEVYM